MSKLLIAICVLFYLSAPTIAGERDSMQPIAKISVLSTGKVLLNETEISPDQLRSALTELKNKNGEVWYYRGNAQGEPPPASSQVIQMVIDNKLPITLSTKRDFSDYVDVNGNVQPR